MFTRRHERDLGEIRALNQELDQRARNALEQIKLIRKAHGLNRHDVLAGEIEALAARYELPDGAADALHGLVRIMDWGQPNFVPKANQSARMRFEKPRLRKKPRRLASNILAESLAGLAFERVRTARRLADIGSGAGFPGLVLAIALPRTHVFLIEKREETCRFLRRATAELGLDNVDVVEARAQDWREGQGACDVATSRNAASWVDTVKLSAALLAPGGAAVVWQKGRREPDKEALAAAAANEAGLRLAQIHRSEFHHEDGVNVKHLYMYAREAGRWPRALMKLRSLLPYVTANRSTKVSPASAAVPTLKFRSTSERSPAGET